MNLSFLYLLYKQKQSCWGTRQEKKTFNNIEYSQDMLGGNQSQEHA